jgi:hypothetical protein
MANRRELWDQKRRSLQDEAQSLIAKGDLTSLASALSVLLELERMKRYTDAGNLTVG